MDNSTDLGGCSKNRDRNENLIFKDIGLCLRGHSLSINFQIHHNTNLVMAILQLSPGCLIVIEDNNFNLKYYMFIILHFMKILLLC